MTARLGAAEGPLRPGKRVVRICFDTDKNAFPFHRWDLQGNRCSLPPHTNCKGRPNDRAYEIFRPRNGSSDLRPDSPWTSPTFEEATRLYHARRVSDYRRIRRR